MYTIGTIVMLELQYENHLRGASALSHAGCVIKIGIMKGRVMIVQVSYAFINKYEGVINIDI